MKKGEEFWESNVTEVTRGEENRTDLKSTELREICTDTTLLTLWQAVLPPNTELW